MKFFLSLIVAALGLAAHGVLAAPAEGAQAANAVEAVAAHKPYWCGDLGKNAMCRIGGCLSGESSKFWDKGCPNGSYYCCVEE